MTASDLFAAKYLFEDFDNLVLELAPGIDFKNVSFDSYDDSFELYEVMVDSKLPLSALHRFGSMGFQRIWLNHLDGIETRYRIVSGGSWRFDRVKTVEGVMQVVAPDSMVQEATL